MIIVDSALKKRHEEGRPIQVGIIGAGYMGRGLVLQIISVLKGMRVACLYNRTASTAIRAYEQSDIDDCVTVNSVDQLEDAIRQGRYAITDKLDVVCESPNIDVIVECTGEIEFGAQVAMKAIENKKHVILMNAELDATIGPVLKIYGDRAGVVVSGSDGDQPGVLMNLYRFVEQIGYHPVLTGNIKGLEDRYRTPNTQMEFAKRYGQRPNMVTAFADGTKLSMEMAVVANATGFKVGQRGMYGPECGHVKEAPDKFSAEELMAGGLVDYVLGAEPGPGVFILGYNEHPIKKQYMNYFKMGDGPLYVFYVPYHLPHLETPISIARVVLFNDAVTRPKNGPVCEVLSVAKTNLHAGERLDGIGGFTCYGLLDNRDTSIKENLLPVGLAMDCTLIREVRKDEPITFDDVELPEGRLVDVLYEEQNKLFEPVPNCN
jgi:predicted homoserine dehydrogenase-like protein